MPYQEPEEVVALAKAISRSRYQDPDRVIVSSMAVVSSGGSITRENPEEEGSAIIASTPYKTRQEPYSYPRWHEYRLEARNLFAAGVRVSVTAA